MLFMLALEVDKSIQHFFGIVRREPLAVELCDDLVLASDVFTPLADVALNLLQFVFVAPHTQIIAVFPCFL